MRAINVTLAIVVSLLFFFGVFEAGLRLLPEFRPQETINQFDSKLGWSKEPGRSAAHTTREFDVTFDINALGLRDDPMTTAAKPAGTYRVVALGDSFVLGFTVDRKHLFVDHLEHWWGEEQRRVDVVNAGTEGYSTDQSVVWFLEHGKDFEPDLVLLFPYENDLYWNSQTEYHGKAKPRFTADGKVETGTLADTSRPKSLLTKLALGQFLTKSVLPLLATQRPGPHDFQVGDTGLSLPREFAPLLNDPPEFVGEAVSRTRGALTALRNRCDELNSKLVMVPIPSESSIHPSEREKFGKLGMKGLAPDLWSPDRPVDVFLELGGELGITTLDPRARLRAAAEEEGELLYFADEWHFNPLGNYVFAKYLHAELGALDVFPESLRALTASTLEAPVESGGPPGWLMLFVGLWLVLGTLFTLTYRDEPAPLAFAKVGGLLAFIFAVVIGGGWVARQLPPYLAPYLLPVFVVGVLTFVAYKLGRRLGTIFELVQAFTLRGHWYLMPLVVVLLTIGSLLVVAASSPLIAPFIYTLF